MADGHQGQRAASGIRKHAARVLALLGLLVFGAMMAFVIGDAADRGSVDRPLERPGSPEARIGADHPGEAVHVSGAALALLVGVPGFVGLAFRPDRLGPRASVAAAAVALLAGAAVTGNPDNQGGQAGWIDPVFVLAAAPAVAAVALARTAVRPVRRKGSPALTILAVLVLPALWYALEQGLLQRNTWPPAADPHHQAHWYAMSLLALLVVATFVTGAFVDRTWIPALVTPPVAALCLSVVSLLAPDAASALPPGWAAGALLWGTAVLGTVLTPRLRKHPAGKTGQAG